MKTFIFLIHTEVYDADFNRIKSQPIEIKIRASTPEKGAEKLAKALKELV